MRGDFYFIMLQLKYNGTNVSRYRSSHENSCPFSLVFCFSTLDLFQHSLAYATDWISTIGHGYLHGYFLTHDDVTPLPVLRSIFHTALYIFITSYFPSKRLSIKYILLPHMLSTVHSILLIWT